MHSVDYSNCLWLTQTSDGSWIVLDGIFQKIFDHKDDAIRWANASFYERFYYRDNGQWPVKDGR